jgi:hypothetical protein
MTKEDERGLNAKGKGRTNDVSSGVDWELGPVSGHKAVRANQNEFRFLANLYSEW